MSITAYDASAMLIAMRQVFFGEMKFYETLAPYDWSIDWIPDQVQSMVDLMNSGDVPEANSSCENCAYARQRSRYDKQPERSDLFD